MNSLNFALNKIERLLDSSRGSRFRQNFVAIAKANVVVQAVALLATPLLTRLYSPAEFGAVALFTSVLSLFLACSTFRLEWSVPNATSRTQAASLIAVGLTLLCCVCTLLLLLISTGLTGQLNVPWKGFSTLRPFLAFLPVALLGGGIHQLMQSWYIREAQLSTLGHAKVAQSLGMTSLNLLSGLMRFSIVGLLLSSICSIWVSITFLLKRAKGLKENLFRLSLKRLYAAFLQFWKESLLSTGVSLVNTTGLAITPILFAQYYSPIEIGWYALIHRLAVVPVGLFSTSIGQSFWSEAAILAKKDRLALKQLYIKSTKHLIIAAIPIVLVCLSGPLFVGKVLGAQEWAHAGILLAALSPMLFGQIVVSPLSHLLVHRKQHWQFVWDVCRLFLIVLTIMVLGDREVQIENLVLFLSFLHLFLYASVFYLNLLCFQNEKAA